MTMNTSDITIICPNGRQLLCHRAVLASRSKRLAAVFNSGDYQGQHLPVSGVDSSALESVISSFYTGECPVSLDTVCAVHDAATKLEVTDLLQSCISYLQSMISLDNCCTLLSVAQQLKNQTIVDFCRQYIHARFTELVGSMDYWKQPYDVVASILIDALQAGRPPAPVVSVAGAWLVRQPARDSLKVQLLTAIGAQQYLGMLDDYLQQNNISQGGSLNLGGADAMQRGMGMQAGMMQPMDNSMIMMNTGMMPAQGMPGMMAPAQNGMYPGMVPQHMMVPMDGTQQGMYGMTPGMGDVQQAGYGQPGMMGQDMSMMNGPMGMREPARNSDRQREGEPTRHNQRGTPARNVTSPGGRAKGGRGRGRGRGGRGAGSGGGHGNGELHSEEDQSDATRSMPANEQNSDGEPNSQATSTEQAAKKGAPGSAGKGAQGGDGTPTHRRSYYGNGLDGVLALAEAAEAAEQKQKGTPGGKTVPAKAEAKVEPERKAEEGEGSGKRKAPEDDGNEEEDEGKEAERPAASKRTKVAAGHSAEGGEAKEGAQTEGDAAGAANDVKVEGETGEMPNLDFVNQVLNQATQALASGQQLVGSSQLPLPNMAPGGGLLPLPNNPSATMPGAPAGLTWDPSQNPLPGTGLGAGLTFDANSSAASIIAQLTNNALNSGTNAGMDAATAAAMNGGLSNSLLESVTNAAGTRPDVSPAAALQQLVSGIVERNNGPRQDPRLIGLPAPPPREDGRGRGKGSRSMQPVKGFCHVENCGADLTGLRDYHQRYKICDYHLKAPAIMRDGVQQRFCQQCGRFHMLDAFDGTRRSCRAMLQRHNARRNKRNPDALGLPPPPNDSSRNPAYLQSLHALQALAAKPASEQTQADIDAQMQAAAAAATAAAAVAAASGLPPGLAQAFQPNLLAGGLAGGLNAALLNMTGNPLLNMTGANANLANLANLGNPGNADGTNAWNLLTNNNLNNLGGAGQLPPAEQQTAEQQQAQQQAQQQVRDLLEQAAQAAAQQQQAAQQQAQQQAEAAQAAQAAEAQAEALKEGAADTAVAVPAS